MQEVLIWSDAHVSPHKRKIERLEDCLKAVEWVFETARSRKIKSILFGGDFFHHRDKIEVYTYQRAYETLKKHLSGNEFDLYMLLGNHDLWFNENTSISSVVPLSSLPGIRVIDKPERIEIEGINWDFVPFTHDPISAVEELKKLPGRADFCLGHIALDGAILHGKTLSDVTIEHEGDMVKVGSNVFSHYKNVFLGHYHQAQQVDGRVEYVGSPLELSFGEAFQKKHILAFSPSDGKKTYVENAFSPKHLILKADELDKYELAGNFVQVVVDEGEIGTTDLIQMKKDVQANTQVASLEVKQRKKRADEHLISDAKSILFREDEMLSRYVDEVGTGTLDRDELLRIGRLICEKSEALCS